MLCCQPIPPKVENSVGYDPPGTSHGGASGLSGTDPVHNDRLDGRAFSARDIQSAKIGERLRVVQQGGLLMSFTPGDAHGRHAIVCHGAGPTEMPGMTCAASNSAFRARSGIRRALLAWRLTGCSGDLARPVLAVDFSARSVLMTSGYGGFPERGEGGRSPARILDHPPVS